MGTSGISVLGAWKVQAMKAVKPPVSSWKPHAAAQMLDALLQRLDVAEHHRGRGAQALAVALAVHASQSSLIVLSGEMSLRTRSTRISPPPRACCRGRPRAGAR
jgi:hypothetical protein